MSAAESSMGAVDLRIVRELTGDARIGHAELGRRVSLSRPAVAERVRRLEELGVITGYGAHVDLGRLALGLQARVSPRPRQRTAKGAGRLRERLLAMGHVLSCVHVTGENCYELAIAVRDAAHLEQVIEQLSELGDATTAVVLSETVTSRDVDVTAWTSSPRA
ncbi:Lrp/AsnC family leucine-responsive transcriptional regulator [Nonomuraea thailandensis]|uniref:Lrp/AsnC family leucine-responsive transcriptional regulator n=1 Tax=Nonomuraea thailandensis TaxID=1188745 RepID=A0A9X2GQC6_9ACTN|nr:Lrp/AsnC family transcriptional regulator [Nonomuraea thailandensis]MCP2361985.1 Lrp/AsnC family leucine-responsive transcriptional regulator [Nonomuraea thailandensis]